MMPSEHGRDPGAAPLLLVGREREWTALHDHVATARAGQGSLILISGEAGIGKTALAEALCDAVAGQGALVLIGRCYDLTETPPYGPWLELFAQYQSADATPLGSTPRLPAAFAERGSIGTATSQAALFDQVRDFFATVAASRPAGTRPLLILLDDLHWADPASLDLLRFLARALTTVPLLLVATYRADELTRRHPLYALVPLLVREAAAVRLDLRRLHPDAIRTLVERRYHLAEADATRLVAYLDTRAEGNPLFLSELLRALEEEGTLDRTADGWVVGDLDRRSVPLLLRQVIDGRVARLGEEAQRLLGVAAVIGQEVPLPLWATVANAEEETLLTVVERAGDAHLLEEAADGIGVRFAHALIREALYAGLSPARRRIVHQRAGEALVALPNPDPDTVAAHFRQAGDARAAEWLVRAGERAQRANAWLSAADRYETALAMRDACGADAAERGWLHYRLAMLRRYTTNARGRAHLEAAAACAAEAADRMLAAHVQYYRGLLHCFAGNVREGLPEIEAGLAALEALPAGEHSLHAPSEALIDTSTGRGSLISWLAQVGRFAEVCALGEAFVTRYDSHGTGEDAPLALMPAYHGLGLAYAHLGHDDAARRAFARSHAINRAADHGQMLGQGLVLELYFRALPYHTEDRAERQRSAAEAEDAWTRAKDVRADIPARFAQIPLLILEGKWDEAYPLALAAHTAGAGNMAHKPYDIVALGPLAYARGETDTAWSLVREWLPDGPHTAPGTTVYYVVGLQRIAVALALDASDLPTARAWLESYERWLAWSAAVLGQAEAALLWSRYYHAAGDRDRAYRNAERALRCGSDPRQPLAILAAHRVLGELDTEAGRFADAEQHFAASLALVDACAAPYERALTLHALAEFRAATGMSAAALALLDEVQTICAPLDAKPSLARAAALAQRLVAGKEPSPAYPAGLTAREVEVLQLVADGLTDGQVAARLFLSPRTVGRHLTSIYTKLGVSTRTAAGRFALEHHLT